MRCYDCSRQLFDFNRFLAEHPNTFETFLRQGALQRQCRAETGFGICSGAAGAGCWNVATNAVNCGCCAAGSNINDECETVEENCCGASFAEFFALMPQDNLAPIAPNTDVDFPHNGACSGSSITRIDGNSFNLADIGTYQIMFVVSITEAGQLILTLNGGELLYTTAGKTTVGAQITGMAIVTTTAKNSVLTVRNPAGNPIALTVTPFAGGTRQTSAHLVITKIA